MAIPVAQATHEYINISIITVVCLITPGQKPAFEDEGEEGWGTEGVGGSGCEERIKESTPGCCSFHANLGAGSRSPHVIG